MLNTGNLNSLTERMKSKAEQDRQEIEAQTRQQFSALSESLRQSSQNALSTTEAAILAQLDSVEAILTARTQTLNRALYQTFGWKCLQALLLALSILMGAALGGWGLLRMAQHKVTNLQAEINNLSAHYNDLAESTAELEATFKGITLYRAQGKDYLLLPEGYKAYAAGKLDKREAIEVRK